MSASLLSHLVRIVAGRPTTRAAVARAVVDEDVPALIRLLHRLGLEATEAQIEQLLDEPGPFLPALRGWT